MTRFIVSPEARSWIEVPPESHFPIQNLPFGLIATEEKQCLACRIGDTLVDLCALAQHGLLPGELSYTELDLLILEGGPGALTELRQALFRLLETTNGALRDNERARAAALRPVDETPLDVPMPIGAFVDFYSGIEHASNVGRMFRPDQPPLLPNYRHLPVGYNGRASSVIVSGEPVRRPKGQTKRPDADVPEFGPTRELDFELEVGFFTGAGNHMGNPVSVEDAEDFLLGFVLVNDWSARDVQRWEYQPLGPFLAKSFATSISSWIVTLDALEPFRVQGPPQEPAPLPHLQASGAAHYDIRLEVAIQTARMSKPQTVTKTNFRELYWSPAQQLAHQTSNGTPIEVGDLYASGTISGSTEGSFGSLLESTWKGERPIRMEETGEERRFLEDGDTVVMTGYCQGEGYRVGFGELRATVTPA
jgi:fumarylacetoacetase